MAIKLTLILKDGRLVLLVCESFLIRDWLGQVTRVDPAAGSEVVVEGVADYEPFVNALTGGGKNRPPRHIAEYVEASRYELFGKLVFSGVIVAVVSLLSYLSIELWW